MRCPVQQNRCLHRGLTTQLVYATFFLTSTGELTSDPNWSGGQIVPGGETVQLRQLRLRDLTQPLSRAYALHATARGPYRPRTRRSPI